MHFSTLRKWATAAALCSFWVTYHTFLWFRETTLGMWEVVSGAIRYWKNGRLPAPAYPFIQRIRYHEASDNPNGDIIEIEFECGGQHPIPRGPKRGIPPKPRKYRFFIKDQTKLSDTLEYLRGLECHCRGPSEVLAVNFDSEESEVMFGEELTVQLMNECAGPGGRFIGPGYFATEYLKYLLPSGSLLKDPRLTYLTSDMRRVHVADRAPSVSPWSPVAVAHSPQ